MLLQQFFKNGTKSRKVLVIPAALMLPSFSRLPFPIFRRSFKSLQNSSSFLTASRDSSLSISMLTMSSQGSFHKPQKSLFHGSKLLDFPKSHYYNLVKSKKLSHDEQQEAAIAVLHELSQRLEKYNPPISTHLITPTSTIAYFQRKKEEEQKSSLFSSLFALGRLDNLLIDISCFLSKFFCSSSKPPETGQTKINPPKGVYLWGG